jgi:Yip1 domain
VSLEREWWLRVLAVLVRPRLVFLALRVEDEDDLEARHEPILLITLLAGMAGVLLSAAWGRLLDQGDVDGLVVAVITFIAGIFYGAAGYFVVGGALYMGARTVGSLGTWRLARQVFAFSCVPLALSLFLTLPVGLAVFGEDLFRAGGSDAGRGGDVYLGYRLAFVAWSLGLLWYGVRTTYGWSWLRAGGALLLLVGFLAIFSLIAVFL